MKSKFLVFLTLVCFANLSAQQGFFKYPRTYYPQAFFDSNQAKKALEKGTSSIKGTAFAIDYINGGQILARQGTVILLFPYTDYIDDWLNLTNRNKNNTNTVYLLPEVFEYRRETTTDAYGEYTFSNLKPGKYYIETLVDYNATGLGTEQTGTYNYYSMDRYGNMTGGSVPTYGVYTYQYATAKRLFKVVEIDANQEVKKANLKPTALVPFVDLDVVKAKTSGIKCYEEKGLLNGNCVTYHSNGKEKINAEWKNNFYEGDYQEYAENGILLAEGKFKKGFKTDLWKYYDKETGKLHATENFIFKNDSSTIEGISTFYYPNGSVHETDTYANGIMDGEMLVYYESGALNIKGMYVKGLLEGIATYYSESGEIIKTEKYLHGKLVK